VEATWDRGSAMFYWFNRGDESLQYEVREGSSGFELTITGPDGVAHVEHFDTADALHERQVALERELLAQGWAGPHGWHV
jgi:hypothetical protein